MRLMRPRLKRAIAGLLASAVLTLASGVALPFASPPAGASSLVDQSSSAQQKALIPEIASFAARIEQPLRRARYLEHDCTPVRVPQWKGHDTRKCRYTVTDRSTGTVKRGLVVLLNPSPAVLSAWIVNACARVRPSDAQPDCRERVFARVLSQSGGQFPVAGIVYEDLIPADGIHEAYAFADGVTVVVDGLEHRGTAPLSADQLEASLRARPLRTASADGFARIIGVTRSEYRAAHPDAHVEGLLWLGVVREEHRKAMQSDRNALIEAWLLARPVSQAR